MVNISTLPRLVFLTSKYPNVNDIYAHAFVHQRALGLLNLGCQVEVFVPSKVFDCYSWDGVKVTRAPAETLAAMLGKEDFCYVHLLNFNIDKRLSGYPIYKKIRELQIKSALYMHGSEVQKYFSRLFDFKFSARELARYAYKDLYKIPKMKSFIEGIGEQCKFVTPSLWMKEEAEAQLGIKFKKVEIIPNGIDTKLFSSQAYKYSQPMKMVTIRPLSSNKYAVDIAIKIVSKLPSSYTLDIYGSGVLLPSLKKLAGKLKVNDRVRFIDEFVPHAELPSILSKYGIYLSPTRMDAQGVMMCEAMANGNLVVSSNNTAVPEFIQNKYNGITADNENINEIADNIIWASKKDNFSRLASNGVMTVQDIDQSKIAELDALMISSFIN